MEQNPATQQQETGGPALCAGGCGFYGSSDTNGFCSVCYKAHQSAARAATSKPAAPAAAATPPPAAEMPPAAEPKLPEPAQQAAEAAAPPAPEDAPAASAAPAEPSQPADEKPMQANRSRCFCCRKKVGLLGFECRCGYVFCSSHRHAQDHNCTFDYAAFDRANLAKANNKVVAAKVDKL